MEMDEPHIEPIERFRLKVA